MPTLIYIIQGFIGILGQLTLLNLLPPAFYGNEFVYAIILTSWLFFAALGSAISCLFIKKQQTRKTSYISLSILQTFLIPVLAGAAICAQTIFNIGQGETIPLVTIFLISCCYTAVPSILQGVLFSFAPSIKQTENISETDTLINIVYKCEAIGAFIGGIAFYPAVKGIINPLFFITLACIIKLLSLFPLIRRNKIQIILTISVILLSILALFNIKTIDTRLRTLAMGKITYKTHVYSPFGTITVASETKDSVSFFQNGALISNTSDSKATEESCEFALLAHTDPRKVLMFGGSLNNSLSHVLQHREITQIDCIEIDPALINVAEYVMPDSLKSFFDDKRLSILSTAPVHFINKCKTRYDVIILQTPRPESILSNRFFTFEFFLKLKKLLNSGGIISFTFPSSESFIRPELARSLSSMKQTLEKVFKHTLIIPGNNAVFLASETTKVNGYDADFFLKKIENRDIRLDYINEFYLPTRFNTFSSDFLKHSIDNAPFAEINRDFNPAAFFYHFLFTLNINAKGLSSSFAFMLRTPDYLFLIAPILICLCVYLLGRKRNIQGRMLILTVAAVGMSEISLEIIMLLIVQGLCGRSFSLTTVMIGTYMAGLAIGSVTGSRSSEKCPNASALRLRVTHTQIAMTIAPILVLFLSLYLKKINAETGMISASMIASIFFTGLIGGFQFPHCNRLYMYRMSDKEKARKTGFIYAADLAGSSLGALLISAVILPILGFTSTLLLIGILNLSTGLLLGFNRNTE